MKISPLSLLLVALLSAVCSSATPPATDTSSPSAPAASTPSPPTEVKWSDIKDLGYDRRAEVMAGVGKLREQLDLKITALEARRAKLTTSDDPVKFSNALKSLDTARTRLLSAITDLGKATSENWTQRHERVANAWINVEDAYEKAAAEAP